MNFLRIKGSFFRNNCCTFDSNYSVMKKYIYLILSILISFPAVSQTQTEEPVTQTEGKETEVKSKKGKGLKGKLKNTMKAVNKELLNTEEGAAGSEPSRLTVNEEGVEENGSKAKEKK